MTCPIDDALRREAIQEIKTAFTEECCGTGTAIAHAVDFDTYAQDVFSSLWGSVTSLYYNYRRDLRIGISERQHLDRVYTDGIITILSVGGISSRTAQKIAQAQTKTEEQHFAG